MSGAVQQDLRKLSPEDFARIVEGHAKWLASEGKDGLRADLSNVDLHGHDLRSINLRNAIFRAASLSGCTVEGHAYSGADFDGANLSATTWIKTELQNASFRNSNLHKAYFTGVNARDATFERAILDSAQLRDCDLTGASLRGADLGGALLYRTQFLRANLRESNLQDAKLDQVKGLSGGQLGGANICGVKLDDTRLRFQGLSTVDESSKSCRKQLTAMLLACMYTILTIATTTDGKLLTNSSSSVLPLLGTAIPIVGFYFAAPLILLAMFVYFHLSLQRLWEGLADLPAIFEDGTTLDKRVYPWLLNGLVAAHFDRLRCSRPPFSVLQESVSVCLAWGGVPFTLLLLWERYLSRHDQIGTGWHILLLFAAMAFGFISHSVAKRTLRGESPARLFRCRATYVQLTKAVLCSGAIGFMSYNCIQGVRQYGVMWAQPPPLLASKDMTAFQLAPKQSITMLNVGLQYREHDPRVWIPKLLWRLRLMPFANLEADDIVARPMDWSDEKLGTTKGLKLEGRNLRYAIAVNAFLVKAKLSKANLEGADLRGADLREADLSDAFLTWALLYSADLRGANLEGAQLVSAWMDNAKLSGTHCTQPDFSGASLSGADLNHMNLQRAKFVSAHLHQTIFEGANLKNADFSQARFFETDLRDADLTEVVGLTMEQIREAITNDGTRLPVMPRTAETNSETTTRIKEK